MLSQKGPNSILGFSWIRLVFCTPGMKVGSRSTGTEETCGDDRMYKDRKGCLLVEMLRCNAFYPNFVNNKSTPTKNRI